MSLKKLSEGTKKLSDDAAPEENPGAMSGHEPKESKIRPSIDSECTLPITLNPEGDVLGRPGAAAEVEAVLEDFIGNRFSSKQEKYSCQTGRYLFISGAYSAKSIG